MDVTWVFMVVLGILVALAISVVEKLSQSGTFRNSEPSGPHLFSIFEKLGDRLESESASQMGRSVKCERQGCGQVNPAEGCYCRRCGQRLSGQGLRES